MKMAIISDVHSNIEALSAVLEAYKRENIDVHYCLGDVVGYGASPNECADLIRKLDQPGAQGGGDTDKNDGRS